MEGQRIGGMGDVEQAARSAGREAGPWLETFARFGYAAKGAVYILVGVIAAAAAFSGRGDTTDASGALASIADSTIGRVALGLIAFGLVGYVVWSFVRAALNPENDSGGKRVFFVITGIIHAALAFQAGRLALDGGGAQVAVSGGSGGGSEWTATLMEQPFGPWLVAIVGLAVALYGLHQVWDAWRIDLDDHLALGSMSAGTRTWTVRFSRFGLAARGVVLAIIGGFFVVAGLQADPSEARGVDGALEMMEGTPWLLGVIALGLVAYGLYNMVRARFRVIRPT